MDNLEKEYNKIEIFSNNLTFIKTLPESLMKPIRHKLEEWAEDNNHLIWTEDFIPYYTNIIREKKLKNIIDGINGI